MTVKACKTKNTVSYVKCQHCKKQIRRGQWVLALYEERLIIHPECYDPVVEKIASLKEGFQ